MVRRFTLQIHVTTVFLVLILVVGSLLAVVSHRMSGELMLQVADDLTQRISRETLSEFQRLVDPVETAVNLVRFDELTTAQTLEQRMQRLPLLVSALDHTPALSSIYLGYPNGDFFVLRHIKNEAEQSRLDAPTGAKYMVQSIEHTRPPAKGRYIYLDHRLNILRSTPRADYPQDYDPRARGWYKQAMSDSGTLMTSPYLFFSDQQVGLTMAVPSQRRRGVVIGADIQLQTLSSVLALQKVTSMTQLAVVDAQGTIFAHEDTFHLVRFSDNDPTTPELARLDNFGVDILALIGQTIDLKSVAQTQRVRTVLTTPYDKWNVAISPLKLKGMAPLLLAMAIPDHQLMASAYEQTRVATLVTLLIFLISIPVTWLIARGISQPIMTLAKEAERIARFQFSQTVSSDSYIVEVNTLAKTMGRMKGTIQRFLEISETISAESNFDRLLPKLLSETLNVADAAAGVLYLHDGQGLKPVCAQTYMGTPLGADALAHMHYVELKTRAGLLVPESCDAAGPALGKALREANVYAAVLTEQDISALGLPEELQRSLHAHVVAIPLLNRRLDLSGAMFLLSTESSSEDRLSFIHALSGTAAVTLEARTLIKEQKDLFEAFIKIIAGAVDTKSPYTGGHCARVPELTKMLAQAACQAQSGPYQHFHMNEGDWETLRVAAWLHDCGKVTTPEFVVDKATKLETLYNRIHEIRMRFEVLKCEAEIRCLQRALEGQDKAQLEQALAREWQELDDDFAFVAQCNEGGEALAPAHLQRLEQIAQRTWQRTLNDRLGLSAEELRRHHGSPDPTLPVTEPLLANRPEHQVERPPAEQIAPDNPWGFKLAVPALLYNRGELYNLSVQRGTLTAEERYKINDHIVQTEIMLRQMPFPRHLDRVPEIAAAHHEKMDGTGYPKRLTSAQLSPEAKMLAIADVFEALTAADRPYKAGKKLSQAIALMATMRDQGHIDPDLFEVFLRQGVYAQYAERFMKPDQIDTVDMDTYL